MQTDNNKSYLRTKSKEYYHLAKEFYSNEDLFKCISSIEKSIVFANDNFDAILSFPNSANRHKILTDNIEFYESYLRLYTLALLSANSTINHSHITEVFNKINKIIFEKIYHKKNRDRVIYGQILDAIKKILKNKKKTIFIDFDKDFEAWLEEYQNFNNSEEDYLWTKLLIYQNLAKYHRSEMYFDSSNAKISIGFRKKTRTILNTLNNPSSSQKEQIEIEYLNLFLIKSPNLFKTKYTEFEKLVLNASRNKIVTDKVAFLYRAKSLMVAYEISSDVSKKIEYIKKALEYFSTAGSSLYYNYLPLFYYLDLCLAIAETKDITSVYKHIKGYHQPGIAGKTYINTRTKEVAVAYTELVDFLYLLTNKNRKEIILNIDLTSISNLHKSNLLDNVELKNILKRYAYSKLQKFNNNIINIIELEKEAKTSYKDEGVLTSMLAGGENKQLELKESYSKNELGRAVSAFANTEGGKIVFGVGEKDKTEKNYKSGDIFLEKYVIYGIEMNEDKFRQDMASHLAHTLNLKEILNKIYEPRVLNFNGKQIVCIDVNNIAKTYGKPVTYDENLYVRRDNRTDKLTAKDTIEFYDSLSQSISL